MTGENYLTLPGGLEQSVNGRDRQVGLRRLIPPTYGPFLSFCSPLYTYFKKVIQMTSRVSRRYGNI